MRGRGLKVVLSHPLVTTLIAAKGFVVSCIMPPNRIFVSTYLGHRVGQAETAGISYSKHPFDTEIHFQLPMAYSGP